VAVRSIFLPGSFVLFRDGLKIGAFSVSKLFKIFVTTSDRLRDGNRAIMSPGVDRKSH
jgi:hypothetical protein